MFRSWFYTFLFAFISSAAFAQDPQLLFVSGATGNPEITLLKPDADPLVLGAHEASEIFPYWSRNGQKIAYASNRTGLFHIHTMDADGENGVRLTLECNGDSLCPSWSPTGDRLVYQYGRSKDWDLYVITADGEEWKKIVDFAWQPDWSPERERGDRIVFVSAKHDAGLYLYTCNPDGTGIQRIQKLTNTIGLIHPVWSRDASLIAYTDKAAKNHEIFVCGPEGGARMLTNLGRYNVYPTWSADGKHIHFLHQRDDKLWQWMSVDVETRAVATLDTIKPERFIRGMRGSWY
jgi:Tol biopolymer transport system component